MKRFRKEWFLATKLVLYPDLDNVYVTCLLNIYMEAEIS